MIHDIVMSRIDFENALYVVLPNNRLRSLQINSSARLITGMPRFSRECITLVFIELHFLPIKARINYKICLLTYKALKHGQPSYLLDYLQLQVPVRPLRSRQSSYSDRCSLYCGCLKAFDRPPDNDFQSSVKNVSIPASL